MRGSALKLDTGKAWTDAVGLISNNRDAVLAVAGLFFFLPSFAFYLLLPEAMVPQEAPPPDSADFGVLMEAMQAQMAEQLANYWWVTLIITFAQWFGLLALMALLTDRGRPTVGDAMGVGGRGLIPYLIAQILLVLGISIGLGVPLGILAAVGGGILGAVLILIAIPLMIYVFVKFTLVPAVIAIEQEMNPIAAIKRSWKLTKGNSLRLFFFLFLLTLAAMVISILVVLVFDVIFAAMGATVQQIGGGFIESLVSASVAVVLLGAIAAVHRQLAGPDGADVSETFE